MMAAGHYVALLTLGCMSAFVAGAIPDQIPGTLIPSAPMTDCSVATDEASCNDLSGCLAITAFPADSEVCSTDFGFDQALKEYVGCRSSALFCTQALVWAANSDGDAFLFTNGCIPSTFNAVTQEEACAGVECTELPGDVVPDCVLNIKDITLLIPIITTLGGISPCIIQSADFNMNGIINILDVLAVIECIIEPECPSTCDALDSGFPCGPPALSNGLTCSIDTEACQKSVGGVCGGSPKLPSGECQVGCNDCSDVFYGSDLPCACPSYACVPKLSVSDCEDDSLYYGACFCSQDSGTGIQNIECFLP